MNSKVKLILVFSLVLTLLLVFSGGVSAADVNSTTLTDSGNDASVVVSSQVSNVNQSSTLNSENNNFDNSTNLLSTDSESKNVYYQLDEVSTVKGDNSTSNNDNVLGAIQDTKNIYISPNGLSNATGTVNDPTDWETAYTNIEDGGTIYFASGEYTSIINQTINKNIILYHDTTTADAILNAKGTGYIFANPNNILNISGLTFVNGTGYNNTNVFGGVIYSKGTLNVNNSKFTNNTAYNGGSIYMDKGNITNCTFNNNIANSYGGAIFISEGNIINCTFNNNTSNRGGAIYIMLNSNVNGCTFNNNSGSNGGAIYLIGGNVSSSKFINNSASYDGGAIFVLTGMYNGIIKGSVFLNNTANGKGTAIFTQSKGFCDYNWWGNNTPFNGNDYNQLIYSNGAYVCPNNWVIMSLTANPDTVNLGSTTLLTVGLNQINTSSGVVSNLPSDIVLPNRTVTFASATGSFNPVSTNISGEVISTYTPTATGNLNATIDNMVLTLPITINTASTKPTNITNTELVTYENGTVVVYVVDDGSIVNTGSVNIFYNNTAIGTAYVRNGEAVINLTGVKPGTYNVTVFYFGKNPFESASKNMPLTILSDISTILTADTFNNTVNAGKNFTGKLVDVNGNPISGQHIALNLTRLSNGASKIYWVTTDVNGEFQLAINLGVGNYTGKAYYYGNGTYLPSQSNLTNITVTKMGTVLTADTFNHTEFTGKNFTGKLVDVNGNPISGQHIALNLTRLSNGASKIYWVTTDVNGEFQLAINLCANNYTGKAYYYGNGTFLPSQSNLTNIIVTKI